MNPSETNNYTEDLLNELREAELNWLRLQEKRDSLRVRQGQLEDFLDYNWQRINRLFSNDPRYLSYCENYKSYFEHQLNQYVQEFEVQKEISRKQLTIAEENFLTLRRRYINEHKI